MLNRPRDLSQAKVAPTSARGLLSETGIRGDGLDNVVDQILLDVLNIRQGRVVGKRRVQVCALRDANANQPLVLGKALENGGAYAPMDFLPDVRWSSWLELHQEFMRDIFPVPETSTFRRLRQKAKAYPSQENNQKGFKRYPPAHLCVLLPLRLRVWCPADPRAAHKPAPP
jgi:hypothetical protein